MQRCLFFIVAFELLATGVPAHAEPKWKFEDIHSKLHDPFGDKETRAIVLVFIATDCPIANYYQPTLSRLTEEYAKKQVRFFLVHSDPDTRLDEIIEHKKEFKMKAPVVRDGDLEIAKRVDARRTPEAFLIDPKGKTLYRGRINDLYADYGKRRGAVREHDLRNALDAFLAGREIKQAKTTAVGCYIPYPKKQPSSPTSVQK